MHDEMTHQQPPVLPAQAVRVIASAVDLAAQALAHQDLQLACEALELADLVRLTEGRLLPAPLDLEAATAAARRVVREATR